MAGRKGREGREGILGGAVTDNDGWYTGDRGRWRRWGLETGEREVLLGEGEDVERRRDGEDGCGKAPLSAGSEGALGMVRLRATFGYSLCAWALSCCGGDLEELVVLCDQRFTFPMPAESVPEPSWTEAAALERRLFCAGGGVGGVAVVWGLDGSGMAALCCCLSDSGRLTVTTDDEDSELERDDRRRCGGGPLKSVEDEGVRAASGVKTSMATVDGVSGPPSCIMRAPAMQLAAASRRAGAGARAALLNGDEGCGGAVVRPSKWTSWTGERS